MSDMKIVYDSISFEEDHKSEFKPYTGSYDALRSAAKIVFWTYPGSGVIARTVESKDLDKNFAINNAYTDKDGRVWGGISYYRGIRNAWICMSDPSGTNIAVSPSPGSAAPSASSNSSPATPSGGTLKYSKGPDAHPDPDRRDCRRRRRGHSRPDRSILAEEEDDRCAALRSCRTSVLDQRKHKNEAAAYCSAAASLAPISC